MKRRFQIFKGTAKPFNIRVRLDEHDPSIMHVSFQIRPENEALFVDATSDRIGIGTIAPSVRLIVNPIRDQSVSDGSSEQFPLSSPVQSSTE